MLFVPVAIAAALGGGIWYARKKHAVAFKPPPPPEVQVPIVDIPISAYPPIPTATKSVLAQTQPTAVTIATRHGLEMGESLLPGDTLTSPNGVFTLWMQSDGNLVLYKTNWKPLSQITSGDAIWASGTSGKGVTKAWMQTDGNFVLYTAAMGPVWSSNTYPQPGNFLILGDDGILAVVSPTGQKKWSTSAAIPVAELKVIAAEHTALRESLLTPPNASAPPIPTPFKVYTKVASDTLPGLAVRFFGVPQSPPAVKDAAWYALNSAATVALNQYNPDDKLDNFLGKGKTLWMISLAKPQIKLPANVVDRGPNQAASGTLS